MTEYTTDPDRIREYQFWQNRTAKWVDGLPGVELYSPTVPRSQNSDDSYGELSSVSEVSSSHSVPPRLMLRYPDGRPDEPIPHIHDNGPRRETSKSSKHSHVPTPARNGGPELAGPIDGPEQIRILPSNSQPPAASASRSLGRVGAASSHSRSRSLPRDAFEGPELSLNQPPIISQPIPGQHHRSLPPPHPAQATPVLPPQPPPYHRALSRAPGSSGGSPTSAWHNAGMNGMPFPKRGQPPSIIYAPRQHGEYRYQPPAIYSHPPIVGPNGMMYSHSVPPNPASGHGQADSRRWNHTIGYANGQALRPGQGYTSPPQRPRDEHTRRRRSRSMPQSKLPKNRAAAGHDEDPDASDMASEDSGSTYYVVPVGKQKVHVVRPQEETIYTASSTTKNGSPTSARSPVSPTGSAKKGFFKRFADMLSIRSSGSSTGSARRGKTLHRRYSEDNRQPIQNAFSQHV